MPSPFPGMDPWLEHPAVFPDLHDSLIIYTRDALNSRLPSRYFANTATRVWVEPSERLIGPDVKVVEDESRPGAAGGGLAVADAVADAVAVQPVIIHVPHDEIREPFVEIRTEDGQRLVTVIELLSLTNKQPGAHGRDLYVQKQRELLDSQVNLVEIDLLRGGAHSTAVPKPWLLRKVAAYDYHICVHRYDAWQDFAVYAWTMDQPIPPIDVPLLPSDPPVRLELQPLFEHCYDAAMYARQARYRERQPKPPLTDAQREWAERVLHEKGL